MKILLLGNIHADADPDNYYSWYEDFINSVVDSIDSSAVHTYVDDLFITIGDGEFTIFDTKNKVDLSEFDVIQVAGSGYKDYIDVLRIVSSYALVHGMRIINDRSAYIGGSKLLQALQFQENGLAVAKTVYLNRAALNYPEKLGIEFPCIMKATIAAHGNDNYLVNSIEEVKNIMQKNKNKFFVLQKFIPNNGDYRILIIGDETLIIKRKAVNESHLNNTSQGGEASIVGADEVPQHIVDDAKKIVKVLHMTIAGVDAIADKNTGEFYFLEVNSKPQLVSGAFVELKKEALTRFFTKISKA